MIEYLTLAGVVLIGVGLALQGWFILDLNRRVTRIMAIALTNTEPPSEQKPVISELSKKISKDKANLQGLGGVKE
tara:strand:- start:8494 stop:8718 length:225 start_codon:yes stop_codon:yes gene_type:complete